MLQIDLLNFLHLLDSLYNPHPLCLVVYYVPSGFTPIVVSHGNSKSTQPYFPTLPSTAVQIKEKYVTQGPKEVVSSVESASGGILEASYPGQLPRNEQQVSNFKRHVPISTGQSLSGRSESNELYSIMLQAHFEDGNRKFIRDVKAYPEPAIVLASDQQLFDLERFCCDSSQFSILTIDPTFSLDDFDVTPTTYRHLMLCSKRTSNPPVMLGPTMIHYRKTFTTYMFFASCMIGQNRNLESLRVFGTDGEKPLIDAFHHEFKSAIHLTCFNHVRRNIKDKLREMMIADEIQTEILNDIFGRRVGSTLIVGLVDSSSVHIFEEKLEMLVDKWKVHDLDSNQRKIGDFCSWFRAHKEDVIRDTMLLPIREEAGLGSPPEAFYTNSSECINNVLKVKVDYKRTELTVFVDKLHQLVEDQQREVEKAMVGSGKYYLQPSYEHLSVLQSRWFAMTKEQRKRCLKKFNEMTVIEVSDCPNTSHSDSAVKITPGDEPSTQLSALKTSSVSRCLSTDFEFGIHSSHQITSDTNIPAPTSSQSICNLLSSKLSVRSSKLGLPSAAIDGISKKAAEILCTDGAIVHAPGHPADAQMVVSRTGKRPHLVLPKRKSGGMACDDDCPQYKSAKLCSHIVAAAEHNKQLDAFIASYGAIKKTTNITKLATADVPKGRGRKGSKVPTKRRPSVPIERRIELHSPSSDVMPNTSTHTSGVDVHLSPTIAPSYQQSLNAPISVTIGGSTTSLPPTGSFASPVSPAYPPIQPMPLGPSASPYSTYYPMMYPSSYQPPCMPYPTPTPTCCGFDPTNGGLHPFRVHFISGNISICNDCKKKYDKALGPPLNICLQHEEWRSFTPHGSSEKQNRFGNAYYHCNSACVMSVWPSFIPTSVVVPVEVQSKLLPQHKEFLFASFGITV